MRSDFRFISCFSGVVVYPGLAMMGELGSDDAILGYYIGFCCFCSSDCLPPSDYLKCTLSLIYLIVGCSTCNLGCVRILQSPAFSVVLWFRDPLILRFWVCQSSWQSSFLWDPENLVWQTSWDPGILISWGIRVPGSGSSSGNHEAICWVQNQDRIVPAERNPRIWSSGVPVFLLLMAQALLVVLEQMFYSPVILRSCVCYGNWGVGVESPLDYVGLSTEFTPQDIV